MEQKEVVSFFDLNIKYLPDVFGISYSDGRSLEKLEHWNSSRNHRGVELLKKGRDTYCFAVNLILGGVFIEPDF
jgi:hypothetical protein